MISIRNRPKRLNRLNRLSILNIYRDVRILRKIRDLTKSPDPRSEIPDLSKIG